MSLDRSLCCEEVTHLSHLCTGGSVQNTGWNEAESVVQLWDLRQDAAGPIRRYKGHEFWDGPFYSVAFDPVHDTVFAGGRNGNIFCWDFETGTAAIDHYTSIPLQFVPFLFHFFFSKINHPSMSDLRDEHRGVASSLLLPFLGWHEPAHDQGDTCSNLKCILYQANLLHLTPQQITAFFFENIRC